MTVTTPYADFREDVSDSVGDASDAGKSVIQDNFVPAMVVTGAFVVWRIGKRVIRSVA